MNKRTKNGAGWLAVNRNMLTVRLCMFAIPRGEMYRAAADLSDRVGMWAIEIDGTEICASGADRDAAQLDRIVAAMLKVAALRGYTEIERLADDAK